MTARLPVYRAQFLAFGSKRGPKPNTTFHAGEVWQEDGGWYAGLTYNCLPVNYGTRRNGEKLEGFERAGPFASQVVAAHYVLTADATYSTRARSQNDIDNAEDHARRCNDERDRVVLDAATGLDYVDLISELERRFAKGAVPVKWDIIHRLHGLLDDIKAYKAASGVKEGV